VPGGGIKRAAVVLLFLIIAAAVIAGGVYFWAEDRYRAEGPSRESITVVIPNGVGLKQIARILHDKSIIGYPWLFVAGARSENAHRALKAGEYAFPARVSAQEVVAILRAGRTVIRYVTIPEGLTRHQIADVLNNAPGLTGAIGPLPPEGSLLPETYDYAFGDARALILRRMQESQIQVLAALWGKRLEHPSITTPQDAVVLASIVEKETGRADERPRIAGVFLNRLRLGMRLQSDPTVAFAVTMGVRTLGRSLSRKDLAIDSPYNTYRIKGLPPGPISNPGRAAIAAVLQPMQTKELYFVTDGAGGHVFAKSLKAHNRNAAKWRKLRDASRPAPKNR
jgi:UPF0755 protein